MKTEEEILEKQLQSLVTSYANMIWNNNQELDFNVEKAMKFEEALWAWIKENFIPNKEIELTINSLQQQVNKVLDIYFRVRKEGLLEEMRRLERISDELKQKIGR